MIVFDTKKTDAIAIPGWAAEALLKAPGSAAKLYIYGLLRKTGEDAEQICAETCMEKRELMEALDALRELGLFEDGEDASVLKYSALPAEEEERAEVVYDDASFNSSLQALFSDRVLSYNDYKTFYECRDVYGLSENVVLMLAEYCVLHHKAKNRLPMSFIREEGRAWAKAGVDTIAEAEARIQMERSAEEGVSEVLKLLGIRHKSPSEEESKLYEKWTKEWGFSLGGIKASMAATTRAQYPSMKYLDGILKELYKEGKLTANDISGHFIRTEEMDDDIKELLSRLGAPRRTVTADMRQSYSRFKAMGFGMEEMKYAASLAAMKGSPGMDYMGMLLAGWRTRGLTRIEEIKESLREDQHKKAGAEKMLSLAGVSKAVSKRDIDTFERFKRKYGMSEDIVFYAAECAYGLSAPVKAIEKILESWKQAGADTLERAKEENRKHRERQKGDSRFSERDYAPGELEELVKDPVRELLKSMEE